MHSTFIVRQYVAVVMSQKTRWKKIKNTKWSGDCSSGGDEVNSVWSFNQANHVSVPGIIGFYRALVMTYNRSNWDIMENKTLNNRRWLENQFRLIGQDLNTFFSEVFFYCHSVLFSREPRKKQAANENASITSIPRLNEWMTSEQFAAFQSLRRAFKSNIRDIDNTFRPQVAYCQSNWFGMYATSVCDLLLMDAWACSS